MRTCCIRSALSAHTCSLTKLSSSRQHVLRIGFKLKPNLFNDSLAACFDSLPPSHGAEAKKASYSTRAFCSRDFSLSNRKYWESSHRDKSVRTHQRMRQMLPIRQHSQGWCPKTCLEAQASIWLTPGDKPLGKAIRTQPMTELLRNSLIASALKPKLDKTLSVSCPWVGAPPPGSSRSPPNSGGAKMRRDLPAT